MAKEPRLKTLYARPNHTTPDERQRIKAACVALDDEDKSTHDRISARLKISMEILNEGSADR